MTAISRPVFVSDLPGGSVLIARTVIYQFKLMHDTPRQREMMQEWMGKATTDFFQAYYPSRMDWNFGDIPVIEFYYCINHNWDSRFVDTFLHGYDDAEGRIVSRVPDDDLRQKWHASDFPDDPTKGPIQR